CDLLTTGHCVVLIYFCQRRVDDDYSNLVRSHDLVAAEACTDSVGPSSFYLHELSTFPLVLFHKTGV
ncbi:hypothetical protein T265_15942, partial [Opisthorchis viverrini]